MAEQLLTNSTTPTTTGAQDASSFKATVTLAQTPITEQIPDAPLSTALAQPPFLPIPSALNLRDLGLVPTSSLRPSLLFRSGTLHSMTAADLARLRDEHNVRAIFDLRTARERAKAPSPELDGVRTVWTEYDATPRQINPAAYAANGGRDAYAADYLEVLAVLRSAIRALFAHVLERPGEGLLFHCTAGKDRTGVVAALLFDLAGADPAAVADEYVLTRLGVERGREMLAGNLKMWLGEDALEKPGVLELSGVSREAILAFLDALGERYVDGSRGYLRELGFSEGEVQRIRDNISREV